MAGKKRNANTAIGYQMARMIEERGAIHLMMPFVCVESKHSTMTVLTKHCLDWEQLLKIHIGLATTQGSLPPCLNEGLNNGLFGLPPLLLLLPDPARCMGDVAMCAEKTWAISAAALVMQQQRR